MIKLEVAWIKAHFNELLRFAGVGGLCTAIYFVALWLTGFLGELAMGVRATIAFIPALISNYLLQRNFTFKSSRKHTESGPRHLIVQLGGMAINSGLLWLTVDLWNLPYWPCQLGTIALMTAWSYMGQKHWAF